jgi:two-component system chemotaxis response regulator CheB
MASPVKVLIVDDSSFMRNILARIISKDDRFEIVGKAVNGEEGVQMAKDLRPDVITMDIEMPVMDGLTALNIIMKECPTRVVMISSLTREGAQATLDAMDKGAVDFIPKQMEGGANSIVSGGKLLLEKLYTAAHIRLTSGVARTLPPARPIARTQTSTSATTVRKPISAGNKPIRMTKFAQARICVIGASTGGPRALQMIIPKLQTLRCPIIIAQHMPANFTGPMAERLDSTCEVSVKEGADGMKLDAGTVYISPGGVHARVENRGGSLYLNVKPDTGSECVYRPSVDLLAQSIADSCGGSAVAFMLTGMGSDGRDGFTSLKKNGAYVVAQNEESSVVYGMPKSVAPIADEIIDIEIMGDAIKRLVP